MALYLTIFERQAKFLNIPEKTFTAYLIGSLPPDIAQFIARENEDDAQNYEKETFSNKKNQPVRGSHDNHSPGPSRTLPRFSSYKTERRNPMQCYGCGTPCVVKSKCPTCTRANKMETAVSCEKLFKFPQEQDVTFTNMRISFMMDDGIWQNIMAVSTVVDLYIEGRVIPTEFLVLPVAKGIKILLGLNFLNTAGIVLDIQGGKLHFSGNPRKQHKFFKTLEDITLSE
ncbi:retrovirus-related Pol polyprotein from transposon 297 [Trichonephila clavipes]|nr:retrovirus-related Pol polyprotein from transposon 297 [Trichonephila clavipes]